MTPADFQEIDLDDRIIRHILSTKTPDNVRVTQSIFQYSPLAPSHIRLLRLYPGHLGDLIHCELLDRSLEDLPDYTYLSYSWEYESLTHSILVNDGLLLISRTLAEALETLRKPNLTLTMWIDAICINPHDLDEKIYQVSLMVEIARNARKTLVWLGQNRENSELAMDFIAHYSDISRRPFSDNEITVLSM